MKRIFTLIAVVSFAGMSLDAYACSMAPVNVDKQVEDMQRFALTALNVQAKDVDSVEVSKAEGNYIWTDPMCPEGVSASAEFVVNYQDVTDPLTKGCTGVVKVSKIVPTGISKIIVKNAYSVEIIQTGICKE
jgi:hypothetical protein